ncbi:response regulator [Nitrincola tapanii]|uniref:Response regulator n=1 Tax=Nitrincola tapanii TaxID=1708751 RepID=A0A5A9W597_9GAMM|nr:response regulator [Nitrincola tapanii]KAA0875927.1 response regulator [Nitrincola tapanii]
MANIAPLNILVVDDVPILVHCARHLLQKLGAANVLVAYNGDDASVILRRHPEIDLVITDIEMPNGNGLELLQWIRTGEYGIRRDLPVIIVTDFSIKDYVMRAMTLDCNGFINKPFNGKTLGNKIVMASAHKTALKSPEHYTEIDTAIYQLGKTDLQVVDQKRKDSLIQRLENQGGISQQLIGVWSQEYKTGDEKMDRLLLHILQLIALFQRHLQRNDQKSEDERLDDLIFYTTEFFALEGHRHREANYPDQESHNLEHQLLLQETEMLVSLIREERLTIALTHVEQLQKAWHQHLLSWDQAFNQGRVLRLA